MSFKGNEVWTWIMIYRCVQFHGILLFHSYLNAKPILKGLKGFLIYKMCKSINNRSSVTTEHLLDLVFASFIYIKLSFYFLNRNKF